MDIYVKPTGNQDNNNSPLVKPFYVIGIVLLALVILAFAGIMIPRLLGIQQYAVEYESLDPDLKVGSLAFVERTDAKLLAPGDMIAYMPDSDAAVPSFLKVIENDPESKELQAQGNTAAYQNVVTIRYDQIKGRVVFNIPLAGYLFKNTKNKWF